MGRFMLVVSRVVPERETASSKGPGRMKRAEKQMDACQAACRKVELLPIKGDVPFSYPGGLGLGGLSSKLKKPSAESLIAEMEKDR